MGDKMSILEVVLIAVGLAMDAFAISVCKGLSMNKFNAKKAIIIGLYFGLFQMIMPCIGYALGSAFENFITSIDHWIVFFFLVVIGGNMIKESFSKDESKVDDDISFKTMIILSIATSIDALAVGITFSFLEVNILNSVIVIGLITFILSIIGVVFGKLVGNKLSTKAQFIGGIILVLIGLKILLEHLSIL